MELLGFTENTQFKVFRQKLWRTLYRADQNKSPSKGKPATLNVTAPLTRRIKHRSSKQAHTGQSHP
tara:strand:- start:446 stop:643 length:198 start_codon:yes stop_codon:yes gene_type:complete